MSKEFEVTVKQVITRRIVLKTTSMKRAKALVLAGPLSYLKAVRSDKIVDMQEEVMDVKECEDHE